MAIRRKKQVIDDNGQKTKKPANWLLRFTIIIFLIPIIILVVVILTSLENSTEPVVGNRFKNQLNPEITSAQIKKVESSLTYNEVEKVDVNLISATLRITINCKDNCTQDQIAAVVEDAYTKVNAILPVNKYFTNKSDTKMYDLEISGYNYIPDATQDSNAEIYICKSKTGAAKTAVTDIISTPKDKEVSDSLLNN